MIDEENIPEAPPDLEGERTRYFDEYAENKETPYLTNIEKAADLAVLGGHPVYYAADQGEDTTGKGYEKTIVSQDVPPGARPTDTQLAFAEQWPVIKSRVVSQIGYDPDRIDPKAEGERVAREYMSSAYAGRLFKEPRSPEEYNALRKVYNGAIQEATEKKTRGFNILKDIMLKYEAEIIETRRNARERTEKAEDRRYTEGREDVKWSREKQFQREQKEIDTAAKSAERSEGIDVNAMSDAVANGQDSPVAIKNARGDNVAAKVKTNVLAKYPKFDFTMADANYKWKQSATNQRTINFAGGALPRLTRLDEQLRALPNKDFNTINKVMRAVANEFGKPEYTNFESNKNAIVQEINTALSGTSQASDMRVQIELENLKASRSPAQLSGAISNLREALIARVDVDLSPLYPIEVVRGQKTLAKYKEEMFRKYRGNYSTQEQSATSGPKTGDVIKGYRFKGGNPADKNNWERAR
ncbi:MAG: hypothetical protein WC455_16460 [Dehalococcoidia bacterium]|jgi:hypothetical protein